MVVTGVFGPQFADGISQFSAPPTRYINLPAYVIVDNEHVAGNPLTRPASR
jgi:hypothetical protein